MQTSLISRNYHTYIEYQSVIIFDKQYEKEQNAVTVMKHNSLILHKSKLGIIYFVHKCLEEKEMNFRVEYDYLWHNLYL